MFNPGDTIIAGISGGSDSIGLLHLLLELDSCSLNIIVAHVNHCLRKAESEKESDFVSKISKKLKLPFEYTEVDTAAYCKHMKLSTENAARELRYNFFFELLEKYSANKIVTAHTLDDQAETVLMRLIRGSGLTGLSGIPPVTKNLARPLIRNPREQVREYLRSKNIEWQEDSSNKSKKFFRNKIRLDLLPLLKSYNPNIVEALFNYAELSRLDQNYINSVAEEEYKKIFKSYEFGLIGDVSTYKSLDKSIRYSLISRTNSAAACPTKGSAGRCRV